MGLIHYNAQPSMVNAALFTASAVAPSGLAYAAGASSTGTFPGSVAQFWKVTFVNEYGETTGSNEATGTPVATGSAVLTWTAPPAGTTAVNVYRGLAAGAENVLVATLGDVATYTDTGTAGTVASPPATANFTETIAKIIAVNATVNPVTLTLTIVRHISRNIELTTPAAGVVIPAGSASSLIEDRLLAAEEIVLDPGDALWGFASAASAVTVVAFE